MARPFILAGPEATDLAQGTWLLEASAGTGKTYTIVGILLRLVVEQGLGLEECLVMTFTRAATAELRERLRRGLHEALAAAERGDAGGVPLHAHLLAAVDRDTARQRLLAAVASLDAALVATIHGVAHRLLTAHALRAGVALGLAPASDPGDAWRSDQIADLLRHWTRRLDAATVALAGPHLAPATLDECCKTAERHQAADLRGVPALGPDDLAARLAAARDHWAAWREPALSLLTDRRSMRRPLGPRQAAEAWDAVGACLAGPPIDLARVAEPLLSAQPTRDQQKAFTAQPWHQALTSLIGPDVGPGIQRHIVEAYQERLRARPGRARELHHDDLILGLDQALAGPHAAALAEAIGRHHRVVLVDEFQDTDPLQWRVLERCFARPDHYLFLIGDPKQAIYGFRGADIHAYLQAAAGVDHRATLDTNYRSDGELIAALNHWFHRPSSMVVKGIAFEPVGCHHPRRLHLSVGDPRPLQLWWQEPGTNSDSDQQAIATACAGEIRRLLANATIGPERRPLGRREIAVLVRSHNEGNLVARALAAVGVPCVRNLRQSVFAGRVASEVTAVLDGILAPHREVAVRGVALTRLVGATANDLATGGAGLDRLAGCLRELRATWLERGFARAWQSLLDFGLLGAPPLRRLASLPDGERDSTDLLHLGDLLVAEATSANAGPEALAAWLEARIAETSGDDDQLLRLERDDEAVRVLTIHSAKGLQWPVVFAPYLWKGKIPGENGPAIVHQGHRSFWIFGNEQSEKVSRARRTEELAEALRLAYVALTRAEHRCYVALAPRGSHGKWPGATTSALAWLADGAGIRAADQQQAALAGVIADPDWKTTAVKALEHPQVAIVDLPASSDLPPLPASASAATVAVRPLAAWSARRQRRVVSSYSRLVRGRDIDEPDRDQVPVEALASDPLPRGARFGTAMHGVFEHADFAADLASIEAVADTELAAQGLDRAHAPALAQLVAKTLDHPLPGTTTALRVAAQARLAELEFLLPVARPGDIAAAFRAHGGPWQAYAGDLADLVVPAGFCTGFIDLIFPHDGAWHVLDWKSNDLGRRGGYDQAALRAEMRHHHYVLQYHLYLVALHRHLALRLGSGYVVDQHLGSAHYLFVRGLAQGAGGWYHQRPSTAMIHALDACFARP